MSTSAPPVDERLPDRLQATWLPASGGERHGRLALWGTTDPGDAARAIGLGDGRPGELATLLPRTPRSWKRVVEATVPAVSVDVLTVTRALVRLDVDGTPAWRRPGPTVLAWSAAARLAVELVAHGRMVPVVEPGVGSAVARWRTATVGEPRIRALADQLPAAAHAVPRPGGIWTARAVLLDFLDDVADALARAGGDQAGDPLAWALTSDHDRFAAHDPGPLAARVEAWSAPVRPRAEDPTARLCVRLSAPPADDESDDEAHVPTDTSADALGNPPEEGPTQEVTGTPSEDDGATATSSWTLDFLLQSVDDPSLLLAADDVWGDAGAATLADRLVPDAQDALVRGLGEAARLFPPIDRSLSDARPRDLELSADEAARFLTDGAPALTAAGLGVQLPTELTSTGRARLQARLRVGGSSAAPGSDIAGHGLDLDAIAAFRWEVAVGQDTLTADEFAELAAHKQSLVRWRGRWVHVDPDELARMAASLGGEGRLEPAAAIAAVLTGAVADDALGTVEVVADDAAAALVERLAGAAPDEPRTDGVDATLRPYQHRGVAWLQARADLGLGAVLADDMGLGKTLQAITLLAGRPGDRPHLVVCPASVVGNWERELARFAPDVTVLRHHGPDRAAAVDDLAPGTVSRSRPDFVEQTSRDEHGAVRSSRPRARVCVTSYGTLRSDAELLGAVAWDVVVLDEAQAFKNHTTRTARVVRSLDARVKLPMTGTPVENRLAELWAIMDVAVPGLLGTFATFKADVATPVERWRDRDAAERLRRLTTPFVLRRTKRDPTVAPDLPDKQEQTVPVTLTAEQATLYQAVVTELLADDDALGEGIGRRGRILKLLTALKQVCNHPAQYLGQRGPLVGRSGKLVRATEILGEVVDAGDRALVFTQYRRMGELLTGHLASELDVPEVPFLHGGTTLARRDAMVEAFQVDESASPILVVSLKAGGTGLNLTRATHVVHYDRWWNPAVEDQATDRAYRIGQHRTVFVHKLTTTGTLEERIAAMLESKRALADAVVGSGEAWLTELDDDEVRELVRLDPARVGDG